MIFACFLGSGLGDSGSAFGAFDLAVKDLEFGL